MPAELFAADDLMRDLLAADATLTTALGGTKIYSEDVPQGTNRPYVVLMFLGGEDTMVSGGYRAYTQPLYLVKGVTDANNWTLAATIFRRIDEVLHHASGVVASEGVVIQSITRERETRFVETPLQGTRIRHYGGQYRLFVSYQ